LTLFVDVQGVPNAILELVKARILANRKRNKERTSAATALKVQQPARRRYYSPVAPDRRPEPAAIPLGDLNVVPVVWRSEEIRSNNILQAYRIHVQNAANTYGTSFDVPMVLFPYSLDNSVTVTEAGDKIGTDNSYLTSTIQNATYPDAQYTRIETMRLSFIANTYVDASTFVLPASKDAAIFVYVYRNALKGYHGGLETSVEFRDFKLVDSAPLGGSTELALLYASDITFSRTRTVPTEWNGQNEGVICVLVSKNAVRKISTPAGLLEKLSRFRPDPSQFETRQVQSTWGAAGSWSQFSGKRLNRGEQPFGQIINIFSGASEPQGYPRWTYSRWDPPALSSASSFLNAAPLLPSYGLGALNTGFHPGVAGTRFYSPGVFSLLNDFDVTGLEENSDYSNYSEIKSTYLSSAPLPGRIAAPCVRGGCPVDSQNGFNSTTPADSYVTFDITRTIPATMTTALSDSVFSKGNARINLAGVTADHLVFYAWDWGKPAYCRQQLFALGFTAADLTP
jgi:hypothetical protein